MPGSSTAKDVYHSCIARYSDVYRRKRRKEPYHFESQTKWIVDNYQKENIVYVVHVGDIVNRGDDRPEQWENAFRALSILEQPLPGKPDGIPYGLAVGNHEQTPSQWAVTGKTKWFNHYWE